jgi:malonyl-CoA O-methyltransferase
MNEQLNKKLIAENFSNAVRTYENWAQPQKIIAEKLTGYIPEDGDFDTILDIGCGTGFVTELLERKYKQIKFTGIDIAVEMIEYCRKRWPGHCFFNTDAENYSRNERFDLIVSNCAFQWFENKADSIGKFCSMLNPGGIFALAVPVQGSLTELNSSSLSVTGRTIQSLNLDEPVVYQDSFEKSKVAIVTNKIESIRLNYNSVIDVLRSLKGIGAAYKAPNYRPFTIRQLKKLIEFYKDCQKNPDDSIPVTYKVLFLVALKDNE